MSARQPWSWCWAWNVSSDSSWLTQLRFEEKSVRQVFMWCSVWTRPSCLQVVGRSLGFLFLMDSFFLRFCWKTTNFFLWFKVFLQDLTFARWILDIQPFSWCWWRRFLQTFREIWRFAGWFGTWTSAGSFIIIQLKSWGNLRTFMSKVWRKTDFLSKVRKEAFKMRSRNILVCVRGPEEVFLDTRMCF